MNNVILRKLVLTADWQPLSASSLVGTVTISTPPTNAGTTLFRTRDEPGHEVPWVPGEYHELRSVDLSLIEAKGNTGDLVTLMGGTW